MRRALVRLAVLLASASLGAAAPADVDIPYQKFVLDSGLTLIVHEDHKAPIVAVNVWYHVGSKNEKRGRTGFAHLFEHLMFNGSEHFNDDYFRPLEKAGASDLNGTTDNDRTNYFQNVPTSALDLVLWLESDRMGHLLGAIDQARLDEQRGVVQNEKRQGENQPYGRVFQTIAENCYPSHHPYSWPVIGSMEDLSAARLEDVKEWFRTYYGAANAVIVLAGDIDASTAKEKVERFFGHIPAGPPVARQERWVAKRTGVHRGVMQDRAPQARVYKVWNVPERGSAEAADLRLAADVLSSGKSSRLFKRLVYDEKLATDVSALVYEREIGAQFVVVATAQPGGDLGKVERAIDEEMTRLLAKGPEARELVRVKTGVRAAFVRGIERIGGFGGKSDILAASEVYLGDPAGYKKTLDRIERASAEDVRRTAAAWLSDGVYVLEVHPFFERKTREAAVDRTSLPAVSEPPEPRFPDVLTGRLDNGLRIVLAARPSVPLVEMNLVVDAGVSSDHGGQSGTAALAMDMLDEGTKTRTALEISDDLALLGANLQTFSTVDSSIVGLSALAGKLEAAVAVLADVVQNPSFPEAELERLRRQQVARIRSEKVTPNQMAFRVLPRLLYGESHPYSAPLTGSGTEESVVAITRDDLVRFHARHFAPANATLVVAGATTLGELQGLAQKYLGGWSSGTDAHALADQPPVKAGPAVYFIDRPGSTQSVILAGLVGPPKRTPNDVALRAIVEILGGTFTSRINMNLREDKHWSYGARTMLVDTRGPRPFISYAAVQADRTKESLAELLREFRELVGTRPIKEDELAKVRESMSRSLPGRWETTRAIRASLTELVEFGLPLDYYKTYADKVRSLTLPEVTATAGKVVTPEQLVWVVVGDRAKVEPAIRSLELGALLILDADGRPVGQP